ncbi:MAG: DNA cytosine methyltransferase [Firmicutes bacterium HGW-Firmicutes-2]|jgi:DNA (cytosine-5)-methyltransferase 1|nr:MAG: DNA cytosine methyltransferase [Firmicutes bacterium HGW-Firmicutes-2]
MYKVIDLFAGAGGMSCGFLQTKKFEIVAATEFNEKIQITYMKNHPKTDMYKDVRTNDYADFIKKYGEIDVVIGGPPCQGFSNANRQKNHLISSNNELVKEFVRAINELKPKSFVMENVKMLASDKHRFFCTNADITTIKELGIWTEEIVFSIDVPIIFVDEIKEILIHKKSINQYLLTKKIYDPLRILANAIHDNDLYEDRSFKKKREINLALSQLESWIIELSDTIISKVIVETVDLLVRYFENDKNEFQNALMRFDEIQKLMTKLNEIRIYNIFVKGYHFEKSVLKIKVESYKVVEFLAESLKHEYDVDYNILNAKDYGAPQSRERFIMVGIRKSLGKQRKVELPKGKVEEKFSVYDAIYDLESIVPSIHLADDGKKERVISKYKNSLLEKLCDSEFVNNHIITDSTEIAKNRFKALKQGQNFHNLEDDQKNTYSEPHRTQNSIYMRLEYNKPSGTVTNVRKSMWIHPVLDRALSVREAARLQTFPDSYTFFGTKDSMYQQVGNAVPPVLGKCIAVEISKFLNDNRIHRGES